MSKFRDKLYKNAMLVVHKWERGVLHSIEHFFNKVEDAVAYSTNTPQDEETVHIKIYNQRGECVHDSHGHHHHHDGYC